MSNPEEKLVEINHLKKYFHVNKGLLHAVDDVSFITTRARHWDLLENPAAESHHRANHHPSSGKADSGEVNFHGENVLGFNKSQMKTFREHVQMVFQDPYSCLNPRLSSV